jgi:uncharacterized membrane protein YgcG
MTFRMARQVCVLAAMSGIPFLAMAQEQAPERNSGNQASIQAEKLTPDQLGDLVAPIALYPDPLLSQVLVASTYPLEVVEARQWLRRNESLKGQGLTDAARRQDWDASVQALVAFPDVLATLNQDIQWTVALGNAFLAQESDVMAAVQRMRGRAQANGKLSSTPQQTVTTETQDGQSAIEIAPADPQVIYVPQYDPIYVWGPPAWGSYPPLAYAYDFGFGPGIDIGFCFGGWGGWGGWAGWGGWGWCPNWFGGSVFVNGPFFRHYHFHGGYGGGGFARREAWQHDPGHRLGVPYPNGRLASRYRSVSLASRSTMARSGNWRSGANTASPYGNRSVTPGSRSGVMQGVRRTTGDQWRRFQGGQRGQAPSRSYSVPSRTYSAPAPRYQSAPRYSAPSRAYSAPAPRYQSAPRTYAPSSAGRSFSSGVGSHRSSSGGGVRSAGGGHSFGGGSHGGGRHR